MKPIVGILSVCCLISQVYGSPLWGPVFVYQRPIDAMVDVTNDLGIAVLQDHVTSRGNFAFSPYGVASVLVLLYEGARGESARQIHNVMRFPWQRDVTRIGFRDIHRHLKTYFSHEGYLSGITLSKVNTSLLPEYQRVLRFYGYDVSLGNPSKPKPTTMTTPVANTTTDMGANTTDMTTLTTPMTNSTTTLAETTTDMGANTTDMTTLTTPMPNSTTTLAETTTDMGANTTDVTTLTTPMPNSTTTLAETTTDMGANTTDVTTLTTPMPNATTVLPETTTDTADVTNVTTSMANETTTTDTGANTTDTPTTTTSMETTRNTAAVTTEANETTTSASEDSSTTTERSATTSGTQSTETSSQTDPEMRMTSESADLSTTPLTTTTVSDEVPGTETTLVPSSTATPEEPTELSSETSTEEANTVSTEAEAATTTTMTPEDHPKRQNDKLRPVLRGRNGTEGVESRIDEASELGATENLLEGDATTTPNIVEGGARMILTTEGGETSTLPAENVEEGSEVSTLPSMNTEEGDEVSTLAAENVEEGSEMTTLFSDATTTTAEELTTGVPGEEEDPPQAATFKVETIVDATTANSTEADALTRTKRVIRDPANLGYPDISLQLQNGMYGSHVSRGDPLMTQLPRYPFLVDGVTDELVPVMSYTAVFPFAFIPRLHSLALEFPLDDERYKLLIILPVERRGLKQLIYDMSSCPLRDVYEALQPTRVNAVIPSFMVEGFVILTSTLQQLGIWDVFDPRRSDLSGMSSDPELFVRNIEQSITVVIRNYVEIVDIQTRTMAARSKTERFEATHPFLYFVMDTETHVALMAGKIIDPLNSRIY